MATTNTQPNIAAFEKVMETVRTSPEETRKFAADPKAYLKSHGLPTEGLKITTAGELSEDQLDSVSGGGWGVCGGLPFLSVGYSW